MLDVISPCVTFNDHEGSTKSYSYVKEHDFLLHTPDFIAHYQEVEVDYEPGTVQDVELQDGSVTRDYDAREVFGDEKAAWWERAVEAWPDYADYQTKTDRQIPVFVLTPVS